MGLKSDKSYKAQMKSIGPFRSKRKLIFAMQSNFLTTIKRVLVPVASGCEEIETVTIIDTLVRSGAEVTVASVSSNILSITCSRGVKIVADKLIEECMDENYDLIACPGGMPGANILKDSSVLHEMLLRQNSSGKFIAAICASPAILLSTHGILNLKRATCYPSSKFKAMIPLYVDEPVVIDGNIITSQGPGTSLLFSLTLVEILYGKKLAKKLATEMLSSYE